jgi:hypothetical protein
MMPPVPPAVADLGTASAPPHKSVFPRRPQPAAVGVDEGGVIVAFESRLDGHRLGGLLSRAEVHGPEGFAVPDAIGAGEAVAVLGVAVAV